MQDVDRDIWLEYGQRKRAERLSEAAQVWAALAAAGGNNQTALAVDFVHISPSRQCAEELRQRLSENYTCSVEGGPSGCWLVKGTTRPYGVRLSSAEHLSWVTFMCDVADSHGCMFSTWSLAAPSLQLTVSSEAFESGA